MIKKLMVDVSDAWVRFVDLDKVARKGEMGRAGLGTCSLLDKLCSHRLFTRLSGKTDLS